MRSKSERSMLQMKHTLFMSSTLVLSVSRRDANVSIMIPNTVKCQSDHQDVCAVPPSSSRVCVPIFSNTVNSRTLYMLSNLQRGHKVARQVHDVDVADGKRTYSMRSPQGTPVREETGVTKPLVEINQRTPQQRDQMEKRVRHASITNSATAWSHTRRDRHRS